MTSAGTDALTTAVSTIYRETGGCTEMMIHCLTGSTSPALIHIDGLHDGDADTGEYIPIVEGQTITFRIGNLGIKRVYAKGDGGNATLNHGVVSRFVGS